MMFVEDEPAALELGTPATATRHEQLERSIIKRLSFLDRFLALWIFLGMVLGILLGCFVPSTQEVLNTATFVSVSIPIGNYISFTRLIVFQSCRSHCHDVSNSLQSQVRRAKQAVFKPGNIGSAGIQFST
jgi:hypothetical protein